MSAMQTFDIGRPQSAEPSEASRVPTSKRRRCALCGRGQDKKVSRSCTTGCRPVCSEHSVQKVVGTDCL